MWVTRSWATGSMPSGAAGGSRPPNAPRPSDWRRSPHGNCCTRRCYRSPIRSPARVLPCARSGLPISCRRWPTRPPIRLCLLNATPCSILASSHRMSDAGAVRLLVFRVGTLLCAVEAERVREILPRLRSTRIPGAPALVAGRVNGRGPLGTVVEGGRALRQGEPRAGGEPGEPGEAGGGGG